MKKQPTEIADVYLLQTQPFKDERGLFVKTFHQEFADELKLSRPAEEFYSISRKGVIRGMHFQVPPAATTKCVFCLHGAILDVVLDLRRHSPSFGQALAFELSAANNQMLYLPEGCAHGFLSLADESIVFYQMSHVYAPNHDLGIRWDSFGFAWPITAPILSARDRALPSFAEFDSPF